MTSSHSETLDPASGPVAGNIGCIARVLQADGLIALHQLLPGYAGILPASRLTLTCLLPYASIRYVQRQRQMLRAKTLKSSLSPPPATSSAVRPTRHARHARATRAATSSSVRTPPPTTSTGSRRQTDQRFQQRDLALRRIFRPVRSTRCSTLPLARHGIAGAAADRCRVSRAAGHNRPDGDGRPYRQLNLKQEMIITSPEVFSSCAGAAGTFRRWNWTPKKLSFCTAAVKASP